MQNGLTVSVGKLVAVRHWAGVPPRRGLDGSGAEAQVALPARADDLLVGGAPQQRVGVLLADVALDGAQLESGQRAAAHHADHAVPQGVKVHQVLAAPVLVVVAPVVPARDATQAGPRRPPHFASRRTRRRRQDRGPVGALADAPVAGARRSDRPRRDHRARLAFVLGGSVAIGKCVLC